MATIQEHFHNPIFAQVHFVMSNVVDENYKEWVPKINPTELATELLETGEVYDNVGGGWTVEAVAEQCKVWIEKLMDGSIAAWENGE